MRAATRAAPLSAAEVARVTLEAVLERRFYVLPHAPVRRAAEQRLQAIVGGGAPFNPRAAEPPRR